MSDGLCQCGCGRLAPLAPQTSQAKGYVKGQPLRFVHGHGTRGSDNNYLIDPLTDCWEWAGTRNADGYGVVTRDGIVMMAHRMQWQKVNGAIPDGMCLLHHCDNPACVNPDHLFLGTKADNKIDCVAKDRHAKWERNGRAILNRTQVLDIRELSRSGIRQKELALKFGVSVYAISDITTGKRWKGLEES